MEETILPGKARCLEAVSTLCSPFQCGACGLAFGRMEDLQGHVCTVPCSSTTDHSSQIYAQSDHHGHNTIIQLPDSRDNLEVTSTIAEPEYRGSGDISNCRNPVVQVVSHSSVQTAVESINADEPYIKFLITTETSDSMPDSSQDEETVYCTSMEITSEDDWQGSPATVNVSQETSDAEDIKREYQTTEDVRQSALVTEYVRQGSVATEDIWRRSPSTEDVRQGSLATVDVRQGSLATVDVRQGSLATEGIRQGYLSTEDVRQGYLDTTDVRQGSLATEDIMKVCPPSEDARQGSTLTEHNRQGCPQPTVDSLVKSACEAAAQFKNDPMARSWKMHSIVDKPYECAHCTGKSFGENGNLIAHIKRIHQSEGNDERKSKPVSTSSSFPHTEIDSIPPNLASKLNLEPVSAQGRLFVCADCGKQFKSKGGLKRHHASHKDAVIKPYGCIICGQNFKEVATLEVHVKVCHVQGEQSNSDETVDSTKNFGSEVIDQLLNICPICGKVYKDKYILKTHLRIHSAQRPHECTVCGKRFREAGVLKTHLRIHSNVKPYGCSLCTLRFREKGAWKAHVRRIHPEHPERLSPVTVHSEVTIIDITSDNDSPRNSICDLA